MKKPESVRVPPTIVWRASAIWLRILLVMSLIANSGCAWLDAHQRNIIYRPTPGAPADFTGLRPGDERYFVKLPAAVRQNASPDAALGDPGASANPGGQRIELWWLPHADPGAPTLLYFHGTFRTVPQNRHKIEALREAGFSVLAVEYRGWGLSTAITPSEQSLLQDADAAWVELQRREPRPSRRVIYGHSMGTGVAVDLASRLKAPQNFGALILESAFTSFADVAWQAGVFASLLLRLNSERFGSIDKITRVQAPLLMIHGTADTTIPISLGRQLFAAARSPKRWLAIEGGAHSDLQQAGQARYQATLRRFKDDYLSGP